MRSVPLLVAFAALGITASARLQVVRRTESLNSNPPNEPVQPPSDFPLFTFSDAPFPIRTDGVVPSQLLSEFAEPTAAAVSGKVARQPQLNAVEGIFESLFGAVFGEHSSLTRNGTATASASAAAATVATEASPSPGLLSTENGHGLGLSGLNL